MNKLKISDFSLEHTLNSGQFFLYELNEESFYEIIHSDNKFKIKQKGNTLIYEGINENDLVHFFSLDVDLNKLTSDFSDKYLLIALEKYWGLRLIRQDLWQCLIGFVCSSASNIPKIKTNLRLMIKEFSDDGTFPKPSQLNNLQKLKKCRTGYRAKYIYEINKMVKENPNLLEEIKKQDYKNSKELLMRFPGVASKVADCVCLFALNHKEAFPIDTWVKQIIERLYLKKETKNFKEIENFVNKYFKRHKGIKQQYLFHYARHNLK